MALAGATPQLQDHEGRSPLHWYTAVRWARVLPLAKASLNRIIHIRRAAVAGDLALLKLFVHSVSATLCDNEG